MRRIKHSDKTFIVYAHINKVNGKKYIGITCQTESQRFRNGKGYKSSKHFYSAIQKYGWNAFEHIVLYRELSEEDAKAKEIELIEKYDTRNSDKGYNMTPGGEGYSGEDNPMFGKHLSNKAKRLLSEKLTGRYVSEETKQKQSASLKGRTFSDETKAKMRESAKARVERMKEDHPLIKYHPDYRGEKNPMYGKHLTDDQKRRMVAHKIYYSGKDNPHAKRVKCIETGIIFETVNEAAAACQCLATTISGVLHGSKKHAGGYTWEFA